jgi:hypothetical protein
VRAVLVSSLKATRSKVSEPDVIARQQLSFSSFAAARSQLATNAASEVTERYQPIFPKNAGEREYRGALWCATRC